MTLRNEKSSSYGGSSCTGNMNYLYCMTWTDNHATASGTLTRTGSKLTLMAPQGTFTAEGVSEYASAVPLSKPPYCESYYLQMSYQADSIVGSFKHQSDCHGAGIMGTFTARR